MAFERQQTILKEHHETALEVAGRADQHGLMADDPLGRNGRVSDPQVVPGFGVLARDQGGSVEHLFDFALGPAPADQRPDHVALEIPEDSRHSYSPMRPRPTLHHRPGPTPRITERAELGDAAGSDASGRLRFVSGIACHNEGDRDRAIDEAGNSLLEMSLNTPRGYFMDGIAFIACFLQRGAERQQIEKALDYLNRFRERLEGVRGWKDVRIGLAWVQGQLHGLLGDSKTAYRCLERVTRTLRKTGPVRHWFAVNIDQLQLYAKHDNDLNLYAIKRILRTCRLNKDLDRDMRKRLKRVRKAVNGSPANARMAFLWLRAGKIHRHDA